MGVKGKKAIRDIRTYGGDESCDVPDLVFIYIAWHKKGACDEEGGAQILS